MKRKFLLTLLLVTSMLGVFTGCEQASSLVEIVTTVQEYNAELLQLILSQAAGHSYDYYTVGATIPVDEGITCTVRDTDSEDTTFDVNLNNWAASDHTLISGYMSVDIEYYSSSTVISNINMRPAMLYFDRTSVSYVSEVYDGDATTEEFTSDSDELMCISIIVDGETLLFNIVGLYK
ncbi:MAG: hypothetical protein LIR47_06695 [Spirochaetota bacterium]|uniref:Lipoprotein n=1 Tax=Sphaerochaeta associata TaxID=1129264 RepID=A0ABY4D967_9SPIR|nr:hypothetical protein [Sphaerochaeta associata]MDT3359016.1 hypothetical protein [Spirochaetota bacterium]UOM50485.1 hypothetical protein MUG09_13060 [Sphaerochaeta associata]SMP66120.1 hypothetical protein SAMN06298221_1237 [Sphaerochaeta associata]